MDEIVAFAELERVIDLPVRTYSSGMYMRLGFAVAAHIEADVLLLDEVFAVGDEAFQRKCFGKIFEFKQRGGTIVFVSHDAAAVERLCDRAMLLRTARRCSTARRTRRSSIPPAARRRGEPRGARAGLQRVGRLRARIEQVTLLGADGDERRAVPRRGSRSRCALRRRRGRPLPPPRLALEVRDDTAILLARPRRHGRPRLGRTARRADDPLRHSTGCRSPTAASTSASGSERRRAGPPARRRGEFVVIRPGTIAGRAARGPLVAGGVGIAAE